MSVRSIVNATILIALFAALAGCITVGPDYSPPSENAPASYASVLPPGLSAGDLEPETIATWWRELNDPALSGLIDAAVTGNKTLQQTAQRVQAARANRGLAYSAFFPTVNASAGATGTATTRGTDATTSSAVTSSDPTTAALQASLSEDPPAVRRSTAYNAGFDASWEIDLFGKTRRSVEAADADLGAARAAYRDALVSLVAEVALAYVELRTTERRLTIAESNLKSQESSLALAEWRAQAGLSDRLDTEQARLSVESTRSRLPGLRTNRENAKNNLTTMLGLPPGQFPEELQAVLQSGGLPVAPRELVIDLPANALRRRPDVRRAERELAAATARIGVTEAELYPQLRLPGSLSYELSAPGTDGWTASLGVGINWNIFDAGAIRRRLAASEATQQEALFAYEASVLGALKEIEAALLAYGGEEQRRAALLSAAEHAASAANLTRLKYKAGLLDFSDVLNAEQKLLSAEDELALSEGETVANFVRLYKALGGGWSAFDGEESNADQ